MRGVEDREEVRGWGVIVAGVNCVRKLSFLMWMPRFSPLHFLLPPPTLTPPLEHET